MFNQCPGQDRRNFRAENKNCNNCGYLAEIFSDEVRVVCPKCGNLISKEKLPSCVDWCKAAKECIGEDRYKQLKGG